MSSQDIFIFIALLFTILAVGGVCYIVLFPYVSGEKKAESRFRAIAENRTGIPGSQKSKNTAQDRRKQIEETLKDLDQQDKEKQKVTVRKLLDRANLRAVSLTQFYITCMMLGSAMGVLIFSVSDSLPGAGIAAFAAAFGLPRWVLKSMRERHQKAFIGEFANALDVIIRGVKSGLPLSDCLQIIATESPEPLAGEFTELCDQQKVGVPLPKGLDRMYQRMPLTEVSFFAIVVAIQQQSGGNLSEVLGNLSEVLRGRRRLEGKVKAFSAEAKASAMIIGSLPILVFVLVYFTTPEYISILWTDPMGHMFLGGSAFWMMCGVLIMRKMINFDY